MTIQKVISKIGYLLEKNGAKGILKKSLFKLLILSTYSQLPIFHYILQVYLYSAPLFRDRELLRCTLIGKISRA